jgi:hypothetical protein
LTDQRKIEELLNKLESRSDSEVVRKNVSGRALSKSDKYLHMAVPTGIVAIPLANIERVISRSLVHPDAVTVVVKNPKEIQQLQQTKPRTTGVPGGVGAGAVARMERIPIGTGLGPGVATCTYYTTTTTTGGEEDACDDDGGSECEADDLE